MEINREEYNWTEKPVIGLSLLVMGGSIDSFGEQIKCDIFYEVGKCKLTGKTAILPTERNQRNDFNNEILKMTNRFN